VATTTIIKIRGVHLWSCHKLSKTLPIHLEACGTGLPLSSIIKKQKKKIQKFYEHACVGHLHSLGSTIVPWKVGSLDTNYIIFRNVDIFKKKFKRKKKL
jgi:hypothetical protein